MATEHLDGAGLRRMMEAAAARLRQGQAHVNALNVFPVPDGDTGSNMCLTMQAVLQELARTASSSLSDVAHAVANGSLRGARGNSGVILSQIFRGMDASFRGAERTSAAGLAAAFRQAAETAYKMVMRPVEGTILTVIRSAAERAQRTAREGGGIEEVLAQALRAARETLARTPELLPVLKKAGVVDAGGQGLVYVLEGFLDGVRGRAPGGVDEPAAPAARAAGEGRVAFAVSDEISRIDYPYDTELFVLGADVPADTLRTELDRLGDSVLVIPGDGETKVHVHTDRPAAVLEACLRYGPVHDVHILNMRTQHQRLLGEEAAPAGGGASADPSGARSGAGAAAVAAAPAREHRAVAVVAVVPGDRLAAIFRSLGCAEIVPGGQTMNPSTEEILAAVERTGADEVIVLPNNGNVVLACRQASELCRCPVHVVPARTIPQGIAAMMAFREGADARENARWMEEAMARVRSGAVTYAVRDGNFDGVPFRQGDILGLAEGEIIAAGKEVEQVVVDVVAALLHDEAEIVTLYYGADVGEEQAAAVAARLGATFAGVDVECHAGGQPHYYYIVSVE